MTPAEQAVLAAAHAFAAAMRAEVTARSAYKLTQRVPGTPAMKVHQLHLTLLNAEDTATEARGTLIRAVRELEPPESKFDIVGAP